jgi:hypothetical protein
MVDYDICSHENAYTNDVVSKNNSITNVSGLSLTNE